MSHRALLCTRRDEADPSETLPGGPWGEADNIAHALEAIDLEAEGADTTEAAETMAVLFFPLFLVVD